MITVPDLDNLPKGKAATRSGSGRLSDQTF